MFDVSWSELLILGLVALVVVGPKELPRFLNTLGKYAGVVKRQAGEFRAVFEQAMREAEMEEIRKEVTAVRDGVKASLDEATNTIASVKKSATQVDDAFSPELAGSSDAVEDKFQKAIADASNAEMDGAPPARPLSAPPAQPSSPPPGQTSAAVAEASAASSGAGAPTSADGEAGTTDDASKPKAGAV